MGTFISTQLAQKLQLPQVPCESTKFLAADGSPMICDHMFKNLQWQAHGYIFSSNVGILPLKCFDMILGQDWLGSCSPMWVHWAKNWMRFMYHGTRIFLHGLTQERVQCLPMQEQKFKGLLKKNAYTQLVQLYSVEAEFEVHQTEQGDKTRLGAS